MAVAAVNKDPSECKRLAFQCDSYRLHTLYGNNKDDYNDIGLNGVEVKTGKWITGSLNIELEPHSVNIIEIIE